MSCQITVADRSQSSEGWVREGETQCPVTQCRSRRESFETRTGRLRSLVTSTSYLLPTSYLLCLYLARLLFVSVASPWAMPPPCAGPTTGSLARPTTGSLPAARARA